MSKIDSSNNCLPFLCDSSCMHSVSVLAFGQHEITVCEAGKVPVLFSMESQM